MESQHLKAYMARTVTGGPWHDHGIGYVSFAGEELLLFLAINDVSHFEESRQYGQRIWDACTQSLAGYPPFQGLSAEQIYNVQLKWWMWLAHGFAFHAFYAPPGSVGIDKRPEALAWRQKTADSGEAYQTRNAN